MPINLAKRKSQLVGQDEEESKTRRRGSPGNKLKNRKSTGSPGHEIASGVRDPRKSTLEDRPPKIIPPNASTDEDGRTWFDEINAQPGQTGEGMILDEDPPFHPLGHIQALDDLDLDQDGIYSDHSFGLPPRFMRQATNGSSDDDFRSVIDDLTIENKRLKAKLKQYRATHDAEENDNEDKLFEVKVHGLAPEQKRQLEETLQLFVSSIRPRPSDLTTKLQPTSAPEYRARDPAIVGLSICASSSEATSESRLVDSGYASISTAGPKLTPASDSASKHVRSGHSVSKNLISKDKKRSTEEAASSSKRPIGIPEKIKKITVVQRLEQLFTGNSEFPKGDCSYAIQQQEVSDRAAIDDRTTFEIEANEGTREAYILDCDTQTAQRPQLLDSSSKNASDQQSGSFGESSRQRPTRPLDLDPDRTQVPADNIQYIRHLGISSLTPGDINHTLHDTDGWIYLNLLINMAQLHTFNVTQDFVRSALTELSTVFELSSDGRMIRWRGGTDGRSFGHSNDRAKIPRSESSPGFDCSTDGSKRRNWAKQASQDNKSTGDDLTFGDQLSPLLNSPSFRKSWDNVPLSGSFHYQPLFVHKNPSESDESSPGESSAATSTQSSRSHPNNRIFRPAREDRVEGTMAFYNGATFYTDISADRGVIETSAAQDYSENQTMGGRVPPRDLVRTTSGSLLTSRPFKSLPVDQISLLDPNDGRDLEYLNESEEKMEFSPEWANATSKQQPHLMDFQASGIGGSCPADHFSVTVETKRPILDTKAKSSVSKSPLRHSKGRPISHVILRERLNAFRLSENLSLDRSPVARTASTATDLLPVRLETLSIKIKPLEPSLLPPPVSYYNPASDSDSSFGDTSSDDFMKARKLISGSRNGFETEEGYMEVDERGMICK